jgi:hypothetical protein
LPDEATIKNLAACANGLSYSPGDLLAKKEPPKKKPAETAGWSPTFYDSVADSLRGILPLLHHLAARLVKMDVRVDMIDPVGGNEVMLAAGIRVVLGQLDAIGTLKMIDGADMLAVRTDDFHVLANILCFCHGCLHCYSDNPGSERKFRQIIGLSRNCRRSA